MSEEKFSAESVAKSEKVVGQLYEVIVNQDGVVLDGNHRLQGNPKWRTKVKETKNRAEEILVRLHAHHRRRVSKEETRSLLLELAKELEEEGVAKEEITRKLVEITPYSESYVCELMPTEFKRASKVEAGRASAPLTEHKPQNLTQLLTCQACGVASSDVQPWEDHEINLCPKHMALADLDQARYLGQYGKKQVPEAKPKYSQAWKDKWEYRKSMMHPKTSKMEEALLEMWREAGYGPVRVHRVWCVEPVPDDWDSPRFNLVFFVDGEEVHKDREDYDAEVRAKIEKMHGVKTVTLPYKTYSHKAKMELWKKIQEAVEPLKEAYDAEEAKQ